MMKRLNPRQISLALLVVAFSCWQFLCPPAAYATTLRAKLPMKGTDITSYGWDNYGDPVTKELIGKIAADGANWVSFSLLLNVHDAGWIDDQPQPGQTAPSLNNNLAKAINEAHAAGLNVAIKLHLVAAWDITTWYGNNLGQVAWYPTKNTKGENVKANFFKYYGFWLAKVGSWAKAHDVGMVVIGTEMGGFVTDLRNREAFRTIINQIRAVFPGYLSYAAGAVALDPAFYPANCSPISCSTKPNCQNYTEPGWCEETDEAWWVSFWDMLDFTGVDFYPDLLPPGSKEEPSVAQLDALLQETTLCAGCRAIRPFPHLLAEITRAGRPGLLTEMGAPSIKGAAICTGCYSATNVNTAALEDLDGQVRLLKALSHSLDSRIGTKLGTIDAAVIDGAFLYGEDANLYSQIGPSRDGYDFVGKPAEAVFIHP